MLHPLNSKVNLLGIPHGSFANSLRRRYKFQLLTKQAWLVTVHAGDLGASQSDPQGNSMKEEPLQNAGFVTESSIPSFVKTDLGPK